MKTEFSIEGKMDYRCLLRLELSMCYRKRCYAMFSITWISKARTSARVRNVDALRIVDATLCRCQNGFRHICCARPLKFVKFRFFLSPDEVGF